MNGQLRISGRPLEKDFVRQALNATFWMRDRIESLAWPGPLGDPHQLSDGSCVARDHDLAVAAENVKFVTSGVSWGFFCSTPGVAIGRNLQRKHAMEMLLTGEPVDAKRALEWGLVNRVVPGDQLDAETLKLAQVLAEKPPATLAAGKRAFYQQMDLGLEQAYKLASGVIAASFAHEEGRAGMEAFIEKRPPPKH